MPHVVIVLLIPTIDTSSSNDNMSSPPKKCSKRCTQYYMARSVSDRAGDGTVKAAPAFLRMIVCI